MKKSILLAILLAAGVASAQPPELDRQYWDELIFGCHDYATSCKTDPADILTPAALRQLDFMVIECPECPQKVQDFIAEFDRSIPFIMNQFIEHGEWSGELRSSPTEHYSFFKRGQVVINFHNDHRGYCGSWDGWQITIWSPCVKFGLLAHEIGHAIGLWHTTEGNLPINASNPYLRELMCGGFGTKCLGPPLSWSWDDYFSDKLLYHVHLAQQIAQERGKGFPYPGFTPVPALPFVGIAVLVVILTGIGQLRLRG